MPKHGGITVSKPNLVPCDKCLGVGLEGCPRCGGVGVFYRVPFRSAPKEHGDSISPTVMVPLDEFLVYSYRLGIHDPVGYIKALEEKE